MSRPGQVGPGRSSRTARYEIRVAGHLDDHWAALLDHAVLDRLTDGSTRLTGELVDQAHLHGLLARIRDVGVPLLSLRTDPGGSEPDAVRGGDELHGDGLQQRGVRAHDGPES